MSVTMKSSRIAFCLAALLAWSSFAVDSPSPTAPPGLPAGAKFLPNIKYVAGGSERQELDLYLPATGTNWPLIVWIHGGGWTEGSKENPPGLRFLIHGFALASLNYRLSQDAIFPAQLLDCKSAIRWLRAHAAENGIDPNHIGVWGASAGGHLVALLGTTGDVKEFDQGENVGVSSRVEAVCDWFGPTDLVQLAKSFATNKQDEADSPPSRLIGGAVSQNIEKAERANPIHYITKDDPPFLIMHGDKDPVVPLEQSQLLAAALQKASVPVTLRVVPGGEHGGAAFREREELDLLYDFFVKYLK
ncbi:MAG TPA: alpha/beta hydrolase [Verrucomicrobiae bacterium]|jgi:acetyl esterase/lipase|nr:alpha/beta hydrolase [Verrucomicrobiae bacterium]